MFCHSLSLHDLPRGFMCVQPPVRRGLSLCAVFADHVFVQQRLPVRPRAYHFQNVHFTRGHQFAYVCSGQAAIC